MILEKIHCVQFYLYEKTTITLTQISGIFGPNGAGKSSLLDAIQIAMLGGNAQLTTLNAQADDKTKTTRTIKGYCLGQYDGESHQRVRDSATTYITLIWRNPKTNRPVSIGLCIAASGDEDKHEVLGRYVADGIEIALTDHISLENGIERPRDWRQFRADLTRRVERVNGRVDEIFYDSAERYIKSFLTLMSRGKDAGSISLFKRAFRFGLGMRFEKSVDAIVREEVLESRPTNVKAFKEITETFRTLRTLVESVEQKIADGEDIIKTFFDADKLEKRSAAWTVIEAEVYAEKSHNDAILATVEAENAYEIWMQAEKKHSEIKHLIRKLESEENSLRISRDSHNAHDRLAVLRMSIEYAKKDVARHKEKAQKQINDLTAVVSSLLRLPELEDQHEVLHITITNLKNIVLSPTSTFESDLTHALELTKQVGKTILTLNKTLDNELEDKIKEAAYTKENIERARAGKSQLPQHVLQLIQHLVNNGIEAVPVCDLAHVSDSNWQPVIESFLNETNLLALLVDETNEKEAFQLYRKLESRSKIYGVKLLMPSRIQKRHYSEGSVAELIVGENDVAVAFLRNIFGDIRCATTNEEALKGGRALTKDGMFVGRDNFERLRLRPEERRLGKDLTSHLANLTSYLEYLEKEIRSLQHKLSRLAPVVSILGTIPESAKLIDSVKDELALMYQSQKKVISEETSMAQLSGEDYIALCHKISETVEKIKAAREQETNASRRDGQTEADFNSKSSIAKQKVSEKDVAFEQAKSKRDETIFDDEYFESRRIEMYNIFKNDSLAMQKHCAEQYRNREADKNAQANKGLRMLDAFIHKHRETPGQASIDDWHVAYPWVEHIVEQLKSTELISYREQMLRAERASQDTFRTDVALTLHNNIVWLEQQWKRLNSVLKSSPAFSNGERYEFKRTTRKNYAELLRFVENVATYGTEEDLFGGPGDVPAQFLELLEETTAPGAAGFRSPIEDYREFFDFDINILREDTQSGSRKIVSVLSKRIGPGSGGEHRAPLYVIAGAALASAYNLEGNSNNGMGLILLDEAFNKMDMQNIIATMKYLESLGLQILLASPGENLATLTAFMQRYYQILRDAENNVVLLEGYDISQEARLVMQSDLPEFHPELIAQEISAMRGVNYKNV